MQWIRKALAEGCPSTHSYATYSYALGLITSSILRIILHTCMHAALCCTRAIVMVDDTRRTEHSTQQQAVLAHQLCSRLSRCVSYVDHSAV